MCLCLERKKEGQELKIASEVQFLKAERDQIKTERDELKTERDQLLTERDQMKTKLAFCIEGERYNHYTMQCNVT